MTTARYTDITLLNGRKVPVRSNRRRLLDRLRYHRITRGALALPTEFLAELLAADIDPSKIPFCKKNGDVRLLLRSATERRATKRVVRDDAGYAEAVKVMFAVDDNAQEILSTGFPKARKASRRALLVTEPGYVAALEDVLALVQNELTRQGVPQAPPIEQGSSAQACADCQEMANERVAEVQEKLAKHLRDKRTSDRIKNRRIDQLKAMLSSAGIDPWTGLPIDYSEVVLG